MVIRSDPLCDSLRSKSRLMTSMRGSHRASAVWMAASMWPISSASIASKMKSWTAQPNSGRMGRSPGAVPRINRIACSMSLTPWASASTPRWSACSGNESPDPIRSAIASSSQADHRAADGDAAGADLHRGAAAFDGHRLRGLDRDVDPVGLDADVALLALDRVALLRGLGDVLVSAHRQRLLGGEVHRVLGGGHDLLIGKQGEGPVVALGEISTGQVAAVEQRAQDVRTP